MSKYAEFHGHFIFGKTLPIQPEGWKNADVNESTLTYHSSSEFIPVYHNNTRVGFVLGYILDIQEMLQDRALILDSDEFSAFENFFFSLAGRFVGYVKLHDQERFYLDPSGTMPVVYSPSKKLVASVPTLMFKGDTEQEINPKLYANFGMPERHLWFPAGLTPFDDIHRILPNHYLDFDQWNIHRHWPKRENLETEKTTDELVDEIQNVMQAIFDFTTKQNTVWLSLTAGYDSRMLIACAKPFLDQIKFFTFTNGKESEDMFVSRKMAANLNLHWEVLRTVQATDSQRKEWIEKTGFGVTDAILEIHPTLEKLSKKGIIAPGVAGEMGRALYWKKSDTKDKELTTSDLLNRMKIQAYPAFVDATNEWMKSVDQYDFFTKIDLAYIEFRSGCWGMPQTYGNLKFGEHVYPFSHRVIYENMLALPADFKFKQQLVDELCERCWPELMTYPFNTYTGLKRVLGFFQRISRIPRYLTNRYGI